MRIKINREELDKQLVNVNKELEEKKKLLSSPYRYIEINININWIKIICFLILYPVYILLLIYIILII